MSNLRFSTIPLDKSDPRKGVFKYVVGFDLGTLRGGEIAFKAINFETVLYHTLAQVAGNRVNPTTPLDVTLGEGYTLKERMEIRRLFGVYSSTTQVPVKFS